MVLLRFCYPIPMTWQVVPWWPSPGACEPGRSRNIAWCHLQQMPVKQMPIIVSHLHGICIPHTHAYVYIKTYTLYIHTLNIYTLYKYMQTYIYLLNTLTYIYTIYKPPIYPRIPMFCYSPSVLTQDSQMVDHFTPTNYSRWNRGAIWLVGGWPTPLKNDGVGELGWWHSQYMETNKKMFQTTNQL